MNAQPAVVTVATSPMVVLIVDHVVEPHKTYQVAVNPDDFPTVEHLLESVGLDNFEVDDLKDGIIGVFRELPPRYRHESCHLEGMNCEECVNYPMKLHLQKRLCLEW